MRFKALELLLLAQSASIIASSALCAREPTVEPTIQAKRLSQRLSPRPSWFIGAYHPSRPYPSSLERNKECYVKSHNDGKTDDSPYILQAIHACDHGGHVVFPKGIHYIIGTALNLTFLSHIDIGKGKGRILKSHPYSNMTVQTSKDTSNSQMTPTTGKPALSSKYFKT